MGSPSSAVIGARSQYESTIRKKPSFGNPFVVPYRTAAGECGKTIRQTNFVVLPYGFLLHFCNHVCGYSFSIMQASYELVSLPLRPNRRIPALDAGVHEIPDRSTLCVVIALAAWSPLILGDWQLIISKQLYLVHLRRSALLFMFRSALCR